MELLKNVAAVLGVILSAASVITLASKTARSGISRVIRKYSNIDESRETISEIKKMLEAHINDDQEFKAGVEATNEVLMEFMRTSCRGTIKDIFYRYKDTKILPLYEKKTLLYMEELYLNALHCNTFAALLLKEMDKWAVDYESVHPGEESDLI